MLKEAGKKYNKTGGGIRNAIRNNCRCAGYHWKFIEQ